MPFRHATQNAAPEAGGAPGLSAGPALQALARQQLLRFDIGAQACAMPIDAVREITELARITALPRMPAFMRGVTNLRGAIVPVIDLGARLGMAATAGGRRSCIVIVEVSGAGDLRATLGLLVDAVSEVLEPGMVELEPVPPLGTDIAADHLAAMARMHGRLVPVLALERVLDLDELAEAIGQHGVQPATARVLRAAA